MTKNLLNLAILAFLMFLAAAPNIASAAPAPTCEECCVTPIQGVVGLRYVGSSAVAPAALPRLVGADLYSGLVELTRAIGLPALINASVIRFESPSGEVRLVVAAYGTPEAARIFAEGGSPESPIAIVGVTLERGEGGSIVGSGEVLLWKLKEGSLVHLAYIDGGRLVLLPGLAWVLRDSGYPPARASAARFGGPTEGSRLDYISCTRDEDCDPYCPPGYYGVCGRYCSGGWDRSCLINCGAGQAFCALDCASCIACLLSPVPWYLCLLGPCGECVYCAINLGSCDYCCGGWSYRCHCSHW